MTVPSTVQALLKSLAAVGLTIGGLACSDPNPTFRFDAAVDTAAKGGNAGTGGGGGEAGAAGTPGSGNPGTGGATAGDAGTDAGNPDGSTDQAVALPFLLSAPHTAFPTKERFR